jgi:hypothetical protein
LYLLVNINGIYPTNDQLKHFIPFPINAAITVVLIDKPERNEAAPQKAPLLSAE